jgi:hypothetical protein
MNAIRIKKHIDSDTIHLPELRPLIGRDVEIVVQDVTPREDSFWKNPSLEELAAEQGIQGPTGRPKARWSESEFEGFDEAVQRWRKEDGEIR